MKPKKTSKATAKDKAWQKKVEEKIKIEKIELNHPKGKERFDKVVKRASKKKGSNYHLRQFHAACARLEICQKY